MAVESASPPRATAVYALLIALGLLAAAVAASTIGYISYQYVTRVELREPPPKEHVETPHASIPSVAVDA